jgi:hypothetical protein
MAALPPIRRFLVEDFKDQKKWISPLLLTLNNFMEAVVNAFNKSITIADNMTGDVKYLTVSTPPTASSPANISWTKPNLPVAVHVGNTQLNSGSGFADFTLSSAVQVQWQMSSTTTLSITNIVGITPSGTNQYTLTLICEAG